MFIYAMEYDELLHDFKRRVILNDKPILIIHMIDKVYAFDDRCTHLGSSLSKGMIKDHTVECKSHHAKFNIETGEVIDKAHIGFVKMPTKPINVYETQVNENKVYVKL